MPVTVLVIERRQDPMGKMLGAFSASINSRRYFLIQALLFGAPSYAITYVSFSNRSNNLF